MLDFYYWCGFLLGDGCFHYKKDKFNNITLDLCIEDKDHLKKFQTQFTGTYKEYNNSRCRCYLSKNKSLNIIKIFNQSLNNKTYNPIKLSEIKINNDQKLALIIGLIDADGWISNQTNRTDFYIGLGLHKSWSSFLEEILLFLKENDFKSKTNIKFYQNMCRLYILDLKFISKINNFIIENKLPILNRKWEKVQNFKTRSEKADIDMELVISLKNKKNTQKEISTITNFSTAKVGSLIRRFKLKGEKL